MKFSEEENLDSYNPEGSVLRKHQLRLIEILDQVDQICKVHQIPYWLSSGTLLGAKRHGGFIPWDDDLDIEMLRPDYLRLVKILKTELVPDKYALQTHETDKNYVLPFAKVRDLHSYIQEYIDGNQDTGINFKYKGVFIDIFPLEHVWFPFQVIGRYLYSPLYRFSYGKNDKWGIKQNLKRFFFFVNTSFVTPCFRFISHIYPDKNVYRHTYGLPFYRPRYVKEIFPLQEIQFENKSYPCPADTDAYLKRIYGRDYMQLPPAEKRKEHISDVSFQ